MNGRPIDEYIDEATKDMEPKKRGEVAKELRTHILDSADALAAERKTVVDDAIIQEVLMKMGPADHVAAGYQGPRLVTASGRPKFVPPTTKTDLMIEAIALMGFIVSLLFILNGIVSLPDIIPTHVGLSGGIDSYGSKWASLLFFVIINILLYGLLTIANRYPYIFNYPVVVTEENAARLYRIAGRMMRWMKALIVWNITLMTWGFIFVLPDYPDQTGNIILIISTPLFILPIILVYYVQKMLKASKPQKEVMSR